MSFSTPWKAPKKVATNVTETPQPTSVFHKQTAIEEDHDAAKGSPMCPPSGPSQPEGSVCTMDSEDAHPPNGLEDPKGVQGSNCSEELKTLADSKKSTNLNNSERSLESLDSTAETLYGGSNNSNDSISSICSEDSVEDPEKTYIRKTGKSTAIKEKVIPQQGSGSRTAKNSGNRKRTKDSANTKINDAAKDSLVVKDKEIPKLGSGSKTAKGPNNPKRDKNRASTAINSGALLRKPNVTKRPHKMGRMSKNEKPGAISMEGSTSSEEDSKRRKSFKTPKVSKFQEAESESSSSLDMTTSSSSSLSSDDTEVQSQGTSLGSQFLRQEAPLVLTPPPAGLDARARLAWIQERRDTGVWVYCDNPGCDKQRYLADVHDPAVLPEKWYCHMNKDSSFNSCEAPEVGPGIAEEEDMIISAYTAGSLVWAKMDGYPEWPAMVDDDPDQEQYYWCDGSSDIPTDYHVTFFDSAAVSRVWVKPDDLRRFDPEEAKRKYIAKCGENLAHRLKVAHTQAVQALPLSLIERLRKYSFAVRYTGPITSRKKRIHTPGRLMEKSKIKQNNKADQVKSTTVKSSAVEQKPEKSPTSSHNPTASSASQRSRRLWLDLDSSKSEDDSTDPEDESNQLVSAHANGRTGETESLVTMNNSEMNTTIDEEPMSEDSVFAIAGSSCGFSNKVSKARKSDDCDLTPTIDSEIIENVPVEMLIRKGEDCNLGATFDSEIIENTPVEMQKVKLPSEAATVPSVDEQALDGVSELGAKFPNLANTQEDLFPTTQDDSLTDL